MREPTKRMKRLKDLKKNYTLRLQSGLIGSLLILLFAFKVTIESEPPEVLQIEVQEEVVMEEVVQTKQVNTPPPPPRPPVPVEVPNDEIIEDDVVELDLEFDLEGPMELPPPPPPKDDDEIEDEVFVVVENPPVLIGGIASVQKRIQYPELARNAGIEGRVVIQFVVTSTGEIANPKVVRGIGGGCDEAALEALKYAKFQPGMQRGRPVNVSYSLPITFSLKSN